MMLVVIIFFVGCRKQADIDNFEETTGNVYAENGLPKDKKITVRAIFPVAGHGKEYFELAVKTFQGRFPNVKIDVHWVEEGSVSFSSRMAALIQSGDEKGMYDWIYSFDHKLFSELVKMGKLETQDELWERALYDKPDVKMKDIVVADPKALFFHDGHLYGTTHGAKATGLFYNRKLFRDNGWNENPEDWNEFLQLCEKIKSKGIAPMVMAGKYPYYFTYGWGAIPHEIGGEDYLDAQYRYRPDQYETKAYITMLERMEEFAKKGYFHPGTVSFDHTQSQMEFLQGKAALITNATWIANEMKEVTPADFEWGFMAFPGNERGVEKVVLLSESKSGYIWKNKPTLTKKWAKELNLWLLNMDIQLKFAQSGSMPVRKDFDTDSEGLGISPSVVAIFSYIQNQDVRFVNNGVRERELQNVEMAKLGPTIQNGYVSIVNGTKTAKQVAAEINRQYKKGLQADK